MPTVEMRLRYWRDRATKAEADLAEAVEALKPFSKVRTADGVNGTNFLRVPDSHPMILDNDHKPAVTIGDFRQARAIVAKHAEIAPALGPSVGEAIQSAGDQIADAVLSWMVKKEFLDGGNEYHAADVVDVLNNLIEAAGDPIDRSAVQLSSGAPVTNDHRDIDPATGQQKGYVVLTPDERTKGFVRPYRDAYRHLKCGKITTMGRALAETYACDPGFYSGTFCSTCRGHFPVGADGEFTWYKMDGREGPKVGT